MKILFVEIFIILLGSVVEVIKVNCFDNEFI